MCYNQLMLTQNERIDDLMFKGLRLIQYPDGYCFNQDSILLSHFVKAGAKETLADLGTGSGILAVLAAKKTRAKRIIGIELQPRLATLAQRNVELNGLRERVEIIQGRMQDAYKLLGEASMDAVCVNPPYLKKSAFSDNEIDICRSEQAVTLEEVIASAAKLLKFGGRFYMVHRADRLAEIIAYMRAERIEPKRLVPIQPTPEKDIDTIIIEGKAGGKPGLKFDKPLTVYDASGAMTSYARQIYHLD